MTGYFALAPRPLQPEDSQGTRNLLMGALGVTPYIDRAIEVLALAERGHDPEHKALVIARDGTVESIDITHPSTIPPFTKAATDAINAASKVPPLPEDFPKDREGVTYCFYYNMYPGETE